MPCLLCCIELVALQGRLKQAQIFMLCPGQLEAAATTASTLVLMLCMLCLLCLDTHAVCAVQLVSSMLCPGRLELAAAAASTPESTSAAWPPEAPRAFVDHLRSRYDFSQLLAIEVGLCTQPSCYARCQLCSVTCILAHVDVPQ